MLRSESPSGIADLVDLKARTVAGRRAHLSIRKAPNGRFVVTGTIGLGAKTRWFTLTAHQPRAVVEAIWYRSLQMAGIEWDRKAPPAQPAFDLARPMVLAQVSSSPFDSIAMEINRRSVNIGAELLLRWAGASPNPADLLAEHVRQVTGDGTGLRLLDGSGLSHDDRVTPLTFISYLARFPLLPSGRGFPMLLPTNGSGTLRKLAVGMPGPGIVRAKTGTLGDVATVVGYLGRPEGVLLISLMYNGSRVYTRAAGTMEAVPAAGRPGHPHSRRQPEHRRSAWRSGRLDSLSRNRRDSDRPDVSRLHLRQHLHRSSRGLRGNPDHRDRFGLPRGPRWGGGDHRALELRDRFAGPAPPSPPFHLESREACDAWWQEHLGRAVLIWSVLELPAIVGAITLFATRHLPGFLALGAVALAGLSDRGRPGSSRAYRGP